MRKPRKCRKCNELVDWTKYRPQGARRTIFRCAQCGGPTDSNKAPRTPGKKKAPAASRIKLKKLDDMARDLCRRRTGCEAKGLDTVKCDGALQWAHILSRIYHKVRWAEDNCLYLCAAHHVFYTFRPLEWREFLKKKIGIEKLEELERRALAEGKVDRLEVYERLKAALEEKV